MVKLCKFCGNNFLGNEKRLCCSRSCASKMKWSDIEFKNRMREILLKNGNRPPVYYGNEHANYNPNRHILVESICACGCGKKISYIAALPKRFISGHNKGNLSKELKTIQLEKRICACGCGEFFECDIQSKRRFFHSHNLKVLPEETRKQRIKKASETRLKSRILCKTPLSKLVSESKEYEKWRKSVFERDKYTCQICGKIGGILNAHHKKRFSFLYKEAIEILGDTVYQRILTFQPLFDINNGMTVCRSCHFGVIHSKNNRIEKKFLVC